MKDVVEDREGQRRANDLNRESSIAVSVARKFPIVLRQHSNTHNPTLAPKMGRRGWTTPEQLDFLTSWIPEFRAHQNNGTLTEYFPLLYRQYLKNFPPTVSSEEIEEEGDASEALDKKRAAVRVVSNPTLITISHTYFDGL